MDGIYVAKIPFKLWLKLNPEKEVFRRSSIMINNFVSEVKVLPTEKDFDKLIKLDETLQIAIALIQNLIKSLDEEEKTFWNSQIMKLEEDVDNLIEIHVRSFQKDPEKDREYLQNASQEASALKWVAGLDWKAFAKVIGYIIESEFSDVEGKMRRTWIM